MPRTGTTLCHPKIGYVDLSVILLSTHKLSFHRWSTLMEITSTLPQIPDTKLTVTSKVQFLQLRHVFRQKCKKTQSLTSDDTRCHHNLLNFSLLNFVFILTSLNSTSLAAQKQNPIFHAANKNLFLKTPFDLRHTSSSSTFYFLTNSARNQPNVNTHTLQPFLATNNKNSGYKMVPPR